MWDLVVVLQSLGIGISSKASRITELYLVSRPMHAGQSPPSVVRFVKCPADGGAITGFPNQANGNLQHDIGLSPGYW